MKTITYILKNIIVEVLILFSLVFLINNYIGNVDKTISSDGIGYYDYLPSLFIHHDFIRKDRPEQEDSLLYSRINSNPIISSNKYVDYNGYKVNKYPCGTALLQLPFFTFTYLTTELSGDQNDGYQRPFQKSVFYSTLFYLFLSIFFLKKVLLLYDIKRHVIILCQLFLVLATSVTHYANFEAGFSHVYSLFAITAFIYFIKSFLLNKKIHHFVLAALFLGLIVILRQPNLLIILFIPFLAGSLENLKAGISSLFNHKKKLLLGLAIFVGIVSIQLIVWYLQTGHFFVYSYQGESFNFLDPHLYSILLSYKKGLFIYTPILLFSILGVIWLAYKKNYYLFFTWVSFMFILTYILSSWWSWYYGCSYGLRAYIDYYTVFFIPFALLLNNITITPKILILLLALPTIPLNIIQTYQYKSYILHWIDMDKESYWKVFLKTGNQYKGILWKNVFDADQHTVIEEIKIGNMNFSKDSTHTLLTINSVEIPDFQNASIIQVEFDNSFQEDNNTKVNLSIDNTSLSRNYYSQDRYLLLFHEKELNQWQTGFYNFEFEPITDEEDITISLKVITGDKDEILKNIRVKILS